MVLRLCQKEHTSIRCSREAIATANKLIYRILVVKSASILTMKGTRKKYRSYNPDIEATCVFRRAEDNVEVQQKCKRGPEVEIFRGTNMIQ